MQPHAADAVRPTQSPGRGQWTTTMAAKLEVQDDRPRRHQPWMEMGNIPRRLMEDPSTGVSLVTAPMELICRSSALGSIGCGAVSHSLHRRIAHLGCAIAPNIQDAQASALSRPCFKCWTSAACLGSFQSQSQSRSRGGNGPECSVSGGCFAIETHSRKVTGGGWTSWQHGKNEPRAARKKRHQARRGR